jgi:hypothetical protein
LRSEVTGFQCDDIATTGGTGSISYSYLNFCGFSVVETTTAANLGLIKPSATDYASSSPNALFGPRTNHPSRYQFESNATRRHSAGLSAFFNLKGLSFEPLSNVPPGLLVSINAWEIVDSEARNVYTYWTPYRQGGHQRTEGIEFNIFGDDAWGRNINMVDIFAAAPGGDEKWDICVNGLWLEVLEGEGQLQTEADSVRRE